MVCILTKRNQLLDHFAISKIIPPQSTTTTAMRKALMILGKYGGGFSGKFDDMIKMSIGGNTSNISKNKNLLNHNANIRRIL